MSDSLLIFLHGYGADGNDLLGLKDPMGPHLPGTRFLAPNAPERCPGNPFGYQWFPIPWLDGTPEAAARASAVRAFAWLDGYLDDLEAKGTPAGRTVLFGFSQGTMMALQVGLRRRQALAGIVGFSGRLLEPESLAGEIRSRPPVLLVHGDQDPVVPFESLAEAAAGLDGGGGAGGHPRLARGGARDRAGRVGTGGGVHPGAAGDRRGVNLRVGRRAGFCALTQGLTART